MRALVLSGGGSRGAFQVGVLKALSRSADWYDVFCGISVGALNCAWLAQYTDSLEGVHNLEKLWLGLTTRSVYKNHCPLGPVQAFWNTSVYDTSPLEKLVTKELDQSKIQEVGKLLRIGAMSLETYRYKVWTEKSPDLVKALLASSAYPVMFSPQRINGETWIDGGVHTVTPIKQAIQMGADEIDVVLSNPSDPVVDKLPPVWAGEVGIRTIEILIAGVLRKDLQVAQLYNELVTAGIRSEKRYVKIRVIEPDGCLPGSPLMWEHQDIVEMIEVGYLKGQEALRDG